MANLLNTADKGVSVEIPNGYSNQQISQLASAMYLQFFREHGSFCYQLDREHTRLTVFAVN